MARKRFLICGVLASLLYIAMNIFVPMLDENYSMASQTVSELSAIGAPTREIWVWLGTTYAALVAAFGYGVWKAAGGNRLLRITGVLLAVNGIFSLFWPPMHLRGAMFTLTDMLHIVWSAVTVLLMLCAMGFGAAALGRRFRVYSIVTLEILIMFGTLTGIEGPRVAQNLPTPWIGVWERIGIAEFMLWMLVLAIVLLRTQHSR